jgi:hypothetical protein
MSSMNDSHDEVRETPMKRREFYRCYDQLLANWFSLSAWIQEEIQYFRQDLHDDLALWRPQEPEPDWTAYANRVEAICREGGLPLVFAAQHRTAPRYQ